ncbi:MAG: GntR family transcriptional regulator [Bacilli bacterium]
MRNGLFETGWNDLRGNRAPTLAHQAALELREMILSGQLAPGQPLLLTETAQRLNMSIMPVREALRRLEFEGLLEQLPQKGARVSPLILQEAEDIYHARISLESRAVFRAAGKMTEEYYKSLVQFLEDYQYAYELGDEARGRKAHEQFHFGLYTLTGSKWTVRLIRVLWDNSERYRRISVPHRGSIEQRMREHFDILQACREGQPEKAARCMEDHLSRTFAILQADIVEKIEKT